MAERGDRPWLPGSWPMPEPFIGGVPAARMPPGTYTEGQPQNIVNSLFSCLEGEIREDELRKRYYENNPPPVTRSVSPDDPPPPPLIITGEP
jgi:hypothetical protein